VLNQIVSEGLCDEPQKKLLQALLEARTITNGMRQTVRLRLAALAPSAEEP
jgi:hypothetical protein